MAIVFESWKNIPDDHWCFHVEKQYRVAILNVQNNVDVCVFISPSDCRGARLILKIYYENKSDAKESYNRFASVYEITSIANAAAIMSKYYMDYDICPQIFFAGNNAMSLDNEDLILGKKEPFLPHAHLVGRHGPNKLYAKDKLALRSPSVGREFNLIGDDSIFDPKDTPLNSKKVPWSSNELEIFRNDLLDWFKSQDFSPLNAKWREWN